MGQKDNGALKRKNEEHDMAIQKRPHVEFHDKMVFEAMDDTTIKEGFPNSGRNVFPLDLIDELDVCTFCDDGVIESDKLIWYVINLIDLFIVISLTNFSNLSLNKPLYYSKFVC
jgi:hypothetical protein